MFCIPGSLEGRGRDNKEAEEEYEDADMIVTVRGCVLNAVSLPYDSLLIQTSCLEACSWLDCKRCPSTKGL